MLLECKCNMLLLQLLIKSNKITSLLQCKILLVIEMLYFCYTKIINTEFSNKHH